MRYFLALFLLYNLAAFGQAGKIDETFNQAFYETFGSGLGPNGGTSEILCVAKQSNGNVLVGGSFNTYSLVSSQGIARVLPNGAPDVTFHVTLDQNDPNTSVTTIAIQTDGKIIIGGLFSVVNGTNRPNIARLNTDGTLDESFVVGEGLSNYPSDIVIQNDGKIIVVGDFLNYNSSYSPGIVRLNTDGSIDTDFNPGSGFANGYSVALQDDGKILVGGAFIEVNDVPTNRIVRLYPDGSVDTGFDTGSGIGDNQVAAIIIQDDDKIVLGGMFNSYNGVACNSIVRLQPDGTMDTGFAATGGCAGTIMDMIELPDGRIIIGGAIISYQGVSMNNLVALTANGTLDTTFSSTITAGTVYGLGLTQSGKIITCGSFTSCEDQPRHKLAVRTLSGELDSELYVSVGASDVVMDVVEQADNKIIIAGVFEQYNGNPSVKLARLSEDGYLDETFDFNGANGIIRNVVAQQDGKIFISGEFTEINSQPISNLARINSDGTLDGTFIPANFTPAMPVIDQVLVQSDGKILVSGQFTHYGGVERFRILRLNTDGTLDTSFDPGTGPFYETSFTPGISRIALDANGKIIASGMFISFNGITHSGITRLNANGSVDNTFNPGTGIDIGDSGFGIFSLIVQPDGKIIIGGKFESFDGNVVGNIFRINADGSYDNSFAQGTGSEGLNPHILSMGLQEDGKIVIGGWFDSYGGVARDKIARLTSTGILDPSFSYEQSGTNGQITRVAIANDRDILLAGYFTAYDGKPANYITRLQGDVFGVSFETVSDVTCDHEGSATAYAYWGTPPYAYEWQTSPISTDSTKVFEEPGIYELIVTDAEGETVETAVLIGGPDEAANAELNGNLLVTEFRPGFANTTWLDGFNDGCVPVTGQLKLTIDPLINFVNANPTPDVISGDTLIWNFTDITYDSSHIMPQIEFTTSTDAVIGDTIDFTLIMTPTSGDADTTNNLKNYAFPVVNGYDPNDKAVYPVGKCDIGYIEPSELLTYTVRFQNTGNSEAINIAVVDSLDTDLDLNSVRVIGKSHDMWTEVLPDNVLKFHFDAIHLADSNSNEPESHGYVIFEVMPLTGLAHNTEISNNVEIYFDFNPAVVTNSVTNHIFTGDLENHDCFLGVEETVEWNVSVFPNPTNGNITVQSEHLNGTLLTLADLQGKIVLQPTTLSGNEAELDLGNLQSGIYLLQLQAVDETVTTVRVVKQ